MIFPPEQVLIIFFHFYYPLALFGMEKCLKLPFQERRTYSPFEKGGWGDLKTQT